MEILLVYYSYDSMTNRLKLVINSRRGPTKITFKITRKITFSSCVVILYAFVVRKKNFFRVCRGRWSPMLEGIFDSPKEAERGIHQRHPPPIF